MIIGQRIYTRFENGYDQGANGVKLSPRAEKLWDKVTENSMNGEYGYSFYCENGISVYTKKDMTRDTRESLILHSYIFEQDDLLFENIGKLFSMDKFMQSYEDAYPPFDSEIFVTLEDFQVESKEINRQDFDALSLLCLKAVIEKTTLKVKFEGSYNLKKELLARIYKKFPLFLRKLISFSTYETALDTKIQIVSELNDRDNLFYDCERAEHSPIEEKYIKRLSHIKENEKLYKEFIKKECEHTSFNTDILISVIEKADIATGVINPFEASVHNAKIYIIAGRYKDGFYLELLKELLSDISENNRLSQLYETFDRLIFAYKKGRIQGADDKEFIRCMAEYTVSYVLNKGFMGIADYPALFDFITRCIHGNLKRGTGEGIKELINLIFEKEFKELYNLIPDMFEILIEEDCHINRVLEIIREHDLELYYKIEADIALKSPEKIQKFYSDVLLNISENSKEILRLKKDYLKLNLKVNNDFLNKLSEKYIGFLFEEFTLSDDFTATEGWEKVEEFTKGTGVSPYDIPVSCRFLDKVFIELENPLTWNKDKWLCLEDSDFYSRLINSVALDEKSRDILKLIKAVKDGVLLSKSQVDYIGLLFGGGALRTTDKEKNHKENTKSSLSAKERKQLISLIIQAVKERQADIEDFDLQLIINYVNKDIKRTGFNTEDLEKIENYLNESFDNIGYSALDYDPIYISLYGYFDKKSRKRAGEKYKEILKKLYNFTEENKSKFTVFKIDNIRYGTRFTRLYMLSLIIAFAVASVLLRRLTSSEYIKGCIDTASFMLSGITVFVFCCYSKGGILKRKIDTGLNVALFVAVWFIFICILQFIL